MTVLPSHALVRFRDTLEFLCLRLAEKTRSIPHQLSLVQLIGYLHEHGQTTFAVNDQFHRIRKLCNVGAHQALLAIQEDQQGALRIERKTLISNAQMTRDELLTVFKRLYKDETGAAEMVSVTKVEISTQEWKALIFQAASQENPEIKYKAGLWCEAEAERMNLSVTTLIVSNEFEIQRKFLLKLAGIFYQASYQLKANADAMFRYASLVEFGNLDGDKLSEAIEIIRNAADDAHGKACDHYAAILYEDQKNYVLAEKYWLQAIDRGVTRAYYCMGVLYRDEKVGKVDHEKSIAFLEKGVEENDTDCLYLLGRDYFEGLGVEKNSVKAKELLFKASEAGHNAARAYLALEVNGGLKKITDTFKFLGMQLAQTLPKIIPASKNKVRVNDPCPCGSGKKYKKCCHLS